MKRKLFVFSVLIPGLLVFSSCNKNLKDDIKDLKKQLEEVSKLTGTNEAITVTTQFKDNNNVNLSVTATYLYEEGARYSNSMIKQADGSYEINIQRIGDLDWEESVGLYFTYNPATKAITRKYGYHNWESGGNYSANVAYDDTRPTGLTFNINIKSFDLATGKISLDVEMAGNEAWSNNNNNIAPRRGAAVSTKFSFDGTLRYFENTGASFQ